MEKILYSFLLKRFAKQEHYKYVLKEYDEKYYYIPKELSYDEATNLLIRQKYSISNELSLLRQKDEKPEEYNIYYQYAEECKNKAEEFINACESWEKYNG